MTYSKGYVRRKFWIAVYRKNGVNALGEFIKVFQPDKVRSLFDKGICILAYPPDGVRLCIIGYRRKPIRFDILSKRLPHFYITKPYGDSIRDIISAFRIKYGGYIDLYKFDHFNSFLSSPIEDEEQPYIDKLDDLFGGI